MTNLTRAYLYFWDKGRRVPADLAARLLEEGTTSRPWKPSTANTPPTNPRNRSRNGQSNHHPQRRYR